MLRFLALLLATTSLSSWAGPCPLKDGDLVFIKSQSNQSKLLKIVTESEWTHVGMAFKNKAGWDIIEAVQPVKWTSLYSFIRRSNQLHFEVFRPNFEFDAAKVKAFAEEQLHKDYDLIFSMDNERWYCSELAWKAYQKGAQGDIGALEKVGDLKVDDMRVMNEAKKRFAGYGMSFDADERKKSEVITPVQMMRSEKVPKVFDHKDAASLKGCVLH